MARDLRFACFPFSVLLPAWRCLPLRRRHRAHQHRTPRLRFEDSRPFAVGNGVASSAASADDSVLASKEMWQRGVGGSIPSMAAYVFGVIGIFRLVRGVLSRGAQPDASDAHRCLDSGYRLRGESESDLHADHGHGRGALSALFHLGGRSISASPCGAMRRPLRNAACALAAACLTRYDGWFLAVAVAFVVVVLQLFPGKAEAQHSSRFGFRDGSLAKFYPARSGGPGPLACI